MDNAILNIPDDPAELKQLVLEMQDKILKLESVIFVYQRELFGRKSEKHVHSDSNQGNLFNEAESYVKPEEIEKEEITYTRAKRRQKNKDTLSFPPQLPRVIIEHKLNSEESTCSCGHCMREFSHYSHEELEITEPKVYVVVHKHYKYICDQREKTEKEKEQLDSSYIGRSSIITAKGPERLLEGSRVSEATLAYIFTAKFCDGLPFYRISNMLTRYNIKIERSTMSGWAIKVHQKLSGFDEKIRDKLLECPVIGVDETRLRVLKVDGQKRVKLCYMWAFYGFGKDGPVVYYHYAPSRGSDVLQEILGEYKGIIISDDWEAYTKFTTRKELVHALCNTHARRYFVKAFEAAGKKGEAEEYLNLYGELYHNEKIIRVSNMSADEIRDYRQEHSKPIIEKMKAWLDSKKMLVLPESHLGKAIAYSVSNWNKLILFLENGLIPIDNNLTENIIRPFVIGRKAWLFNAVDKGAEASCAIYTLIENAKANRLEPYWYLRYLFINYPAMKNKGSDDCLLPSNVAKADLENFQAQMSARF